MKKPRIRIRSATQYDIEGIVEVEMERYKQLHLELGNSASDLHSRFSTRLENIGQWYLVASHEDKIVGSLSALPTNNSPEEFSSWEECTNHGLCSSYNPNTNYKNLYIVNLDVSYEYTKHDVQYSLMSSVAVKAIRNGFKLIYFESRMPDFRAWVESSLGIKSWSELADEERFRVAEEYVSLRNENNLPIDRLLRFYVKNGFKVLKIVEEAFKDPESLNFGVVFSVKSPINPKSKIGKNAAAFLFGLLAKSPKLLSKVI